MRFILYWKPIYPTFIIYTFTCKHTKNKLSQNGHKKSQRRKTLSTKFGRYTPTRIIPFLYQTGHIENIHKIFLFRVIYGLDDQIFALCLQLIIGGILCRKFLYFDLTSVFRIPVPRVGRNETA